MEGDALSSDSELLKSRHCVHWLTMSPGPCHSLRGVTNGDVLVGNDWSPPAGINMPMPITWAGTIPGPRTRAGTPFGMGG